MTSQSGRALAEARRLEMALQVPGCSGLPPSPSPSPAPPQPHRFVDVARARAGGGGGGSGVVRRITNSAGISRTGAERGGPSHSGSDSDSDTATAVIPSVVSVLPSVFAPATAVGGVVGVAPSTLQKHQPPRPAPLPEFELRRSLSSNTVTATATVTVGNATSTPMYREATAPGYSLIESHQPRMLHRSKSTNNIYNAVSNNTDISCAVPLQRVRASFSTISDNAITTVAVTCTAPRQQTASATTDVGSALGTPVSAQSTGGQIPAIFDDLLVDPSVPSIVPSPLLFATDNNLAAMIACTSNYNHHHHHHASSSLCHQNQHQNSQHLLGLTQTQADFGLFALLNQSQNSYHPNPFAPADLQGADSSTAVLDTATATTADCTGWALQTQHQQQQQQQHPQQQAQFATMLAATPPPARFVIPSSPMKAAAAPAAVAAAPAAPATEATLPSLPSSSAATRSNKARTRGFVCEVCRNKFFRKQDLHRHEVTHTRAKTFACSLGCGRSFGRIDALTRHMKGGKCAIIKH